MPAFVVEAVKLTEVPEQILFVEALMLTVGVIFAATDIVIVLLIAEVISQGAIGVITTLTASLSLILVEE